MFAELQSFIQSNPIVAGGAGMAVMGWAMMQAKNLPVKVWRIFQDQFSSTVTIFSEDSAFRLVNVWLSQHPSAKHSRRFGIATWWDPRKEEDTFVLTPGEGLHVLRDGWRLYLVNRKIEESQSQGFSNSERKQRVSITTFGRSQEPLQALFRAIMAVREDHETIPVYTWGNGGYSLVERRAKRPMDTVYIAEALRAGIIADLRCFQDRRQWYVERSIPYRRGYLLKGPPGTGKSTLIFAIASLLEKPVYIINPAALDNDMQLQNAMNAAGAGIVVIEDIDSLRASKSRKIKVNANPPAPGQFTDNSKSGVTLSGLLNAVDGIAAREGRVLFITSNHAETLDPALYRPGRVDKEFLLDLAGVEEAEAMWRSFFPDVPVENLPDDIREALPISPAELQNRLLGLAEAS